MRTHEIDPADIKNHLESAEISLEQNYNQLDGVINNQASSGMDLTDGQTYEEMRELAPETLPDEKKSSILGMLRDYATDSSPEYKPEDRTL